MTNIAEGRKCKWVFMICNFEKTERWEDKASNTEKLGNGKLASPPLLYFHAPFPVINYKVYPFKSFTLTPVMKCLVVSKLNLFTRLYGNA